MNSIQGILLVDKSPGSTSFQIVSQLRRATKVETIGHAGTLDPFATGVMVMLIGRNFTKRSNEFLSCDKQYRAAITLGKATDTHDIEGNMTFESMLAPSLQEVEAALRTFQGEISQVPPMFSAKKVQGKKLYDLARKGIEIERQPVLVRIHTQLLQYQYPLLEILVDCSKGTYIRSLAHDLGQHLQCGAHLSALQRTRSGSFTIQECLPQARILDPNLDLTSYLRYL